MHASKPTGYQTVWVCLGLATGYQQTTLAGRTSVKLLINYLARLSTKTYKHIIYSIICKHKIKKLSKMF